MRLIMLLLMTALAAISVAPAAAQERGRCFPETGQCISGRILNYWERNGGLAVFGYPTTPLRTETVEGSWTGPVQWFERDRLEDHGAQGVLAGRLGARMLDLQGRPWQQFPRSGAPSGCRWFDETGHALCGIFRQYWERNGGLERFGYPVTDPFTETIDGWTGTVQYFERRRMEHHTELAGTPYEVLLGLLGNRVLAAEQHRACVGLPDAPRTVQFELNERIATVDFRDQLICPSDSYYSIPAAIQSFEHGTMIWFDLGAAGKKIVSIRGAGHPAPFPTYGVFDDTYREGDPPVPGTPPPGKYIPQRGFGKVWQGSRGQGMWLGLGTTPERPDQAAVQYFGGGGFVVHLLNLNAVYVFGPQSSHVTLV